MLPGHIVAYDVDETEWTRLKISRDQLRVRPGLRDMVA